MSYSEKTDAIFKRFEQIGIIPVVVLHDPKDAKPLGKVLIEGGLPVAEVTFRTDAAEESIRILTKEFPDMLVGAGTVLTIENVDRAVAAGAKFIVSPGFDPKLVSYCIEKGIPVSPGVQTPSEMIGAMNLGLRNLKFFPAEASGGLPMIKAITAALTEIRLMPTGGINEKNVAEYLASDKIICTGGSWMVKSDLIDAGKFDEILERTKRAAAIVKEVRG
ncbi:MAG: bifunctional 4-hydroxy-2-oxoglutarate aldolase/2-dehydro-3-deoxy-phosphogluconate aldolase [Bilifractor sp.]|jgi:2-dehydro-3-deoxyphosphogluconate aldolase/(4S)-4-hydroxy-2-oxoglutarate aldolase